MLLAFGGATALADPLPTPAMSASLTANPNPFNLELPDWVGGELYVGGALTGLALWQSSPAAGDHRSLADLSNGQLFIQKTDGWLQFYAQVGAYSLPTVGVPYTKASTTTQATFGYVPVAYVKVQGQGVWSTFSLEAGKLPTLIGDEYTFTFENMNIERGLLWNLEPAVSRGVQANYSSGPLNISLSWNDGIYSNNFNWLSGLLSYAFNAGADTLAFAGGGNLGGHNGSLLNRGNVLNLIYTHTSGPWTLSPYLQYVTTPATPLIRATSEVGAALLATYALDDHWKISGRVELETSSGHNAVDTPNILGYGGGSRAWSATLTPTYQWKQFFARADLSYVGTGNATPGDLFGSNGTDRTQVRLVMEAGIVL
ncbi:MAG TPA: outer membrane beta-barrel protein [Rhizomicrobium sp.]|jgi:hypothetical protein|nr:outer membrane beta-barrel protein [Rhizomicrobium sp.]